MEVRAEECTLMRKVEFIDMARAMIGCAFLREMVLLCCQFCDNKTCCEWVAQAVADAGQQGIGELLQAMLRRGREARGVLVFEMEHGLLMGQPRSELLMI